MYSGHRSAVGSSGTTGQLGAWTCTITPFYATHGQGHLFGRRHPPPQPGLLVHHVDRVHLRNAAVERDPVRGLAPADHVHERLELVPACVTCVR